MRPGRRLVGRRAAMAAVMSPIRQPGPLSSTRRVPSRITTEIEGSAQQIAFVRLVPSFEARPVMILRAPDRSGGVPRDAPRGSAGDSGFTFRPPGYLGSQLAL